MTKSGRYSNGIVLGCMICMASVLAAVMPTSASAEEPKSSCHYVRTQTLPIHFNGFRPTIEASADGHPITMLVDTGMSAVSLFEQAADRFDLNLRHLGGKWVGMGGLSRAQFFHAKEFKIGASQGKNVLIPVIRDYAAGIDVDGLVGVDFLFQSADLEISLTDRYLKFFKPQGCEDTFLAYWDANASVIPWTEGTKFNPKPVIEILVNGKKLRALIDSGSSSSMIDLRAAADLGITPNSPNVIKAKSSVGGIGEHQTDVWIAPIDSVEIGDETIKNTKIEIVDMWEGATKDARWLSASAFKDEPEVILGVDFLRSHRMLFSVMQRNIYVSYLGGKVFRTGEQDDLTWYKTAALRGDTDAQFNLGQLYLRGSDIPRDAPQAAALFSKLAEQDDHRAQSELGALYENGDGVAKDIAQAVAWYGKSAEGGNMSGQLNLARMYEHGNGVEKDQSQALNWYRKAAEQNDSDAQIKVGVFYLQGKGISKDDAVAHEWLSRATKAEEAWQYQNVGLALFNLGLYAEGANSLRQAVEKSPTAAYSGLWLYLAEAREGKVKDSAKTLEANMSKWNALKWPGAIADLYLGRTTPEQFMKLAHDADKKIDAEQACEANYYAAEWHLISHRKEEAQTLLKAAVRDCPKNLVEYTNSVAEIELLDGK